jgi:hypothetical protein
LLAGGEGSRIILLAQNFVGALHQRLGAADVLQGRKAQAGQAQQMLGLGQTPVLAAGTEDGFQALIEALLITLQLRHQTLALGELIGTGQLREALGQALFVELEALRLIVQRLHLAGLLRSVGLQVTHLPDTPATDRHAGGAEQQGDNGQAVASARRLTGGGVSTWASITGWTSSLGKAVSLTYPSFALENGHGMLP